MSTGLPLAPTLPARRTEEPLGTESASMTSTHTDNSTTTTTATPGSTSMRAHAAEFDKPPQRASGTATPEKQGAGAAKAAGGIGDRVRGTFDVVHGAGEVLRGTVQSALDSFGDSITARDKNAVPARTQGGKPDVASKGMHEFHNGLDKVMGRTPRHGSDV